MLAAPGYLGLKHSLIKAKKDLVMANCPALMSHVTYFWVTFWHGNIYLFIVIKNEPLLMIDCHLAVHGYFGLKHSLIKVEKGLGHG